MPPPGVAYHHFRAVRLRLAVVCRQRRAARLRGLTLAGIYPVGMKIAADYYEKGLGRALGYLVGAVRVRGMAVVAASPQFSALVARRAPAGTTGTALTLVTCLGFALTIVSLQCFAALQGHVAARYLFLLLVPGPLLCCWPRAA